MRARRANSLLTYPSYTKNHFSKKSSSQSSSQSTRGRHFMLSPFSSAETRILMPINCTTWVSDTYDYTRQRVRADSPQRGGLADSAVFLEDRRKGMRAHKQGWGGIHYNFPSDRRWDLAPWVRWNSELVFAPGYFLTNFLLTWKFQDSKCLDTG